MNIYKSICCICNRYKEEITIPKPELGNYYKQDQKLKVLQNVEDNKLIIEVHKIQNGTCFFAKVQDKYYLVTATHVLSHFDINSSFIIIGNKELRTFKIMISEIIKTAPKAHSKYDLAILELEPAKLNFELIDCFSISNTSLNINYDDEVLLLGFPFIPIQDESINPFSIHSHVSNPNFKCLEDKYFPTDYIWIDKPNIEGMSGGPLLSYKTQHVLGVNHGEYYTRSGSKMSLIVSIKHIFELI